MPNKCKLIAFIALTNVASSLPTYAADFYTTAFAGSNATGVAGNAQDYYQIPATSANATASTTNGTISSSGLAQVNIATGQLRAASSGQTAVYYPPGESNGAITTAVGSANAGFHDLLTFYGLTQPTTVNFTLDVHGTITGVPASYASTLANPQAVNASLSAGNAYAEAGVNYQKDANGQAGFVTYNTPNVDTISLAPGDIHFILHANALVSPLTDPDTDLPIAGPVTISLDAHLGSLADLSIIDFYSSSILLTRDIDFGHTAQLSIDLPNGLSYTSASGVLLSQSAVPLPTASMMFAPALLTLLGWRRRRAR